jgi:uncharacterized protein YukE
MSDSDLKYEHASIADMAGELKQFVNQIDNRLSRDVESRFKALIETGQFSGLAADSFRTASAAWNAKCQEYQTTLTQLQLAVTNASGDMDAKDKSLMGLFT